MNPPTDERLARDLRGFGPLGVAAMIVILLGNGIVHPLSAVLVLGWVHLSRTPWREIGYVRPRSWVGGALLGLVFGSVLKFVVKALVMPLFGTDPINHAYHYLVGNRAALPGAIFMMIVVAGFGEETVFRGYLFERFGKLLGSSVRAKVLIVLITSLWFALGHYAVQGVAGAGQAMLTGLAFGTTFAVTGRIWMLMWAHAAYDLVSLAIIYWDQEAAFAHLIFK